MKAAIVISRVLVVILMMASLSRGSDAASVGGAPTGEPAASNPDSTERPGYHQGLHDITNMPSEKTAFRLSLAGTLAPLALSIAIKSTGDPHSRQKVRSGLILTGMMVGPSVGYFYGGCAKRGLAGIGVRALTGAATWGLAAAIYNRMDDREWDEALGDFVLGTLVVGAGGLALITEDIYDLAKVKEQVRQRNLARFSGSIALTPALVGRYDRPGVELSIRF